MRVERRGSSPISYVQVFGERNSATTYLAKFLQDNMKEPENLLGMMEREETPLGHKIFGYKHWFIDEAKLDDPRQVETLFVVIYRNPYTWVRAMMDRPYALERSIGGRSVSELPEIKLSGHINGRDTANEFDPETGEKLTLFELRRKKIESFEGLKSQVDNVVYLNFEALLEDPAGTIRGLAAAFGSVFRDPLQLDRAPFKHLIEDLRAPQNFSTAELAVLNDAIDWTAEATIGYGKAGAPKASTDHSTIVILHGGSSVGKTHLMKTMGARYDGVMTIEVDACKYWTDEAPKTGLKHLQAVIPDATKSDFTKLMAAANTKSNKTNRSIAYLLSELGALLQSDKSSLAVATCGALPDPGRPDAPSIYSWLSARLPVTFLHLLVDVPDAVHREQMQKRGRAHLQDDIELRHGKMRANRQDYDAVVADADGIAAALKTHRNIDPPLAPQPGQRAPNVRIRKAGLKYIQVYGERSSGTKYLTQLLIENVVEPDHILGSYATKSDPINKAKLIGYKHYYPRADKLAKHQHQTLFLVIYKNPYTWIRSMLGKPYHFKACLEGKGIADLAKLPLEGVDIHGREIPDLHPKTGKRITMFELRKHKILEWEKLTGLVGNVVYLNYEDLLVSPTEVM